MTKQEHINYWLETANDDWEIVDTLFKSQKYVQALFFAHFVLQKLCKVHWVKDNDGNNSSGYFEKGNPFISEITKSGIELYLQ